MGPLVIVEPEVGAQLPPGFPGVGVSFQVHLLVLHPPPQPLHPSRGKRGRKEQGGASRQIAVDSQTTVQVLRSVFSVTASRRSAEYDRLPEQGSAAGVAHGRIEFETLDRRGDDRNTGASRQFLHVPLHPLAPKDGQQLQFLGPMGREKASEFLPCPGWSPSRELVLKAVPSRTQWAVVQTDHRVGINASALEPFRMAQAGSDWQGRLVKRPDRPQTEVRDHDSGSNRPWSSPEQPRACLYHISSRCG